MKQYVYRKLTSLVFIDTERHDFILKDGDVVTLRENGKFEFGDHVFSIAKDDLKECFERIYTREERNRYDRIHENAMIAAMQSLIANLKDYEVSSAEDAIQEIGVLPKNAIWFADRLVYELKEKEF